MSWELYKAKSFTLQFSKKVKLGSALSQLRNLKSEYGKRRVAFLWWDESIIKHLCDTNLHSKVMVKKKINALILVAHFQL